LNGRTVYGGGGIMPDYFVPLDTSLNSHYLNELFTSTAILEYTFKYAEDHKEQLEKKGIDEYLNKFKVTDSMLEELVRVGVRNKVKPDYKDLSKKKKLFQIHVKAQIARKIWGNEGSYPVYNETNEVFQQALKVFERIPDLDRSKM
jgi:carboxyl-terminal processing protease